MIRRAPHHSSQQIPPQPQKKLNAQPRITDPEAINQGAIANERVVAFKDREALERFLANLGEGVSVIGRIDELNVLRIRFNAKSDLTALLDGTEDTSLIFPAKVPEMGQDISANDPNTVGSNLLALLGITGDNSKWGTGLKIAVLDTGIADHSVFTHPIERISLIDANGDPSELNPHGTGVASTIFSNNPNAPGILPGATAIDIQIADKNGFSDTFLIAAGILKAVEEGANIINLSMGGTGRSTLVDQALAKAKNAGIPVVISAGNDGGNVLAEPAARPGVIAVGSINSLGQPSNFSSAGDNLAFSTPGNGVTVAYPGERVTNMTGTSPAAGAATAMIGFAMWNNGGQKLTGTESVNRVTQNLNDVGDQGFDNRTGGGSPDAFRINNAGRPGVIEAGITSMTTTQNQVRVLVQNQGTEPIVNTGVSVRVGNSSTTANVNRLLPNESRMVTINVAVPPNQTVRSSINLSGNLIDQRPVNNQFSITTPKTSR